MNSDLKDRKPATFTRKARAVKRLLCWNMSAVLPVILAVEFPKSGGTWIARMIASASNYSFARNNLSTRLRHSVLLGHYTYAPQYKNVFVIYRDGRDVMVSAYHQFLHENEWNDPRSIRAARQAIGYTDQDEPYNKFSDFVEWMFNGYSQRRMRFTWSEFVRSWIDIDVPKVRYEDMLMQPRAELVRLCGELGVEVSEIRLADIIEENSFKVQSKQAPLQEGVKSFARKGIAGDWRNVFDRESAEIFERHAGSELIKLGYEADSDWVATCDATDSNDIDSNEAVRIV